METFNGNLADTAYEDALLAANETTSWKYNYAEGKVFPYHGAYYELEDDIEEKLQRGRQISGHSVTLGSRCVFVPLTYQSASDILTLE
ncbi:MAG TPA: hypothetical protein VFN51_00215 [Candidatus Saccharimonadales bacterium]|nr:hypothetical protein [Candidatus Saccharimonadales bacterium]